MPFPYPESQWCPLDLSSILNLLWQFFGVRRDHIGLVAPCRFKILDSQPEKSDMGPVSIDSDDFGHFQKISKILQNSEDFLQNLAKSCRLLDFEKCSKNAILDAKICEDFA